MKNYIRSLFFATALSPLASFAQTFSVFQHSGYTAPENTFRLECDIHEDATLVRVVSKMHDVNGAWTWYIDSSETRKIADADFALWSEWLHAASLGAIHETQFPCDVGSSLIHGFLDGKDVQLDSFMDCGMHSVNLAPEASQLVQVLRAECQAY